MVTFSTDFKNVANYRQSVTNAHLIHYISLAISEKECNVLDKAIKPCF